MFLLSVEIFTIKNILVQKNIVSEAELEKAHKDVSQILEEFVDETIKEKYVEMISEKK